MKILTLFFTLLVLNNFAQNNLIRNGDFEQRDVGLVTNENPYRPCKFGQVYRADNNSAILQGEEMGAATAPYWLSFGNPNSGEQYQATIFDSRSVCSNDLSQINNPNICYSANCIDDEYRVGIPNNFYEDGSTPTPHRSLIDGNLVIGRYVGIQTQTGFTNQGIQTKISEPIECNAVYNLNFYAIKKMGNTVKLNVRFSVTGKWNDPIAYNDQGDINDEFVVSETATWQEINRQYNFQNFSGARVWMLIRVTKNGAPQGRVLLDDFSFTKVPCNSNKPCSSVSGCDLDGIQVYPTVLPPNNLTITGLEVVTRLEVDIFAMNGAHLRYYDIINPPFIWIWDGALVDGTILPQDDYAYVIKVSNDCKSKTITGVSNKLTTNSKLFNVEAENSEAGLVIRNLDNVNLLKLTIGVSNGQNPLFYREYIDPPNRIGWIGLDNNGQEIAPNSLTWKAEVSNNCGTEIFTGGYSHINEVDYYDFLHDPPPVNKLPFDCGPQFSIWSKPYDRPPIKCCDAQPDIYLSNINIGFNADYRALNNIYIGDNVVVDEFSQVIFWAGNAVEILPGAQGVDISSATIIIAPCEKMMTNNEEEFIDEVENIDTEVENITLENAQNNASLSISPNPTSDEFNITSLNGINIEFIEIFNSQGLLMFSKRVSSLRTSIDVSSLTKGIYICKVMIGNELLVEKLIIN
jgi:hypothetical protein